MRALHLDHPILPEAQFLRESWTDSEWLRPCKDVGDTPPCRRPYALGHHYGMDCGEGGDPVYAGVYGTARIVDHGPALGRQIAVQWAAEPRLWLLSAHLERRTVGNGVKVQPDTLVGVVGGSGGVQPHLHWTVLIDNRFAKGSFLNPVAALNHVKEALVLTEADVKRLIQEGNRSLLYALFSGSEVPKGWLGSDFDWRLKLNLQKILEKP